MAATTTDPATSQNTPDNAAPAAANQALEAAEQSAYERAASSPLNEFEQLLVESGDDDSDFLPSENLTSPAQTTDDQAGTTGPQDKSPPTVTEADESDGAGDVSIPETDPGSAPDGATPGSPSGEEDGGERKGRAEERIAELTREKHEYRERLERLEAKLAEMAGKPAEANLLETVPAAEAAAVAAESADPFQEKIAQWEVAADLPRKHPEGYTEGNKFYSPEQLEAAARRADRELIGLRAQQAVWQQQRAQTFAAQEAQFRAQAAQRFEFLTKPGSPEHVMAKQILHQLGPVAKRFSNWPVLVGILAKGLVEFEQGGAANHGAAANNTGAAGGTVADQHRSNPAPAPGAGPNPPAQPGTPQPRRPRAPQVGAGSGSGGAPRTGGGAARAHGDPMQALVDAAGNEDEELAAIIRAIS
jgi:hypothetical protein